MIQNMKLFFEDEDGIVTSKLSGSYIPCFSVYVKVSQRLLNIQWCFFAIQFLCSLVDYYYSFWICQNVLV